MTTEVDRGKGGGAGEQANKSEAGKEFHDTSSGEGYMLMAGTCGYTMVIG